MNPERYVLKAIRDQLAAFREGAGSDVDILVDLNFNYKTEGFLKVARAMEPFDLFWVEIDTRHPGALRYIRERTTIPVATGECLFGRREYRPFFEHGSMDALIVDVPWNGFAESLKVASMADTYEVNVAPHNFYSHLATMMSANLCAVAPNVRIMEFDTDQVPWMDELVTNVPQIQDGYLKIPEGPGWGTEVNEAAIRAHPPRTAGNRQSPPHARTVKGKGRRGGRLRRPFRCGAARGVAVPALTSRSPGGRCGAATTLTVLRLLGKWEGHAAGKG